MVASRTAAWNGVVLFKRDSALQDQAKTPVAVAMLTAWHVNRMVDRFDAEKAEMGGRGHCGVVVMYVGRRMQ
jgi:hypothetical protein